MKDDFRCVFRMHNTIVALIEMDVADAAIAIGIVLKLVVERGPVAEVAPAEVGLRAIRALKSVGKAMASSKALVCSDWV